MKASGIARLRLHNQRLTGAPFRSPVEAVRWFGAVQAQELPSSLYAIGLRTKNATEASVEQAIASGAIVRTWPMRRTIHCMAAEDARWMIRLLAPRGIARMRHYHQLMEITDDHLDRAGKIFESVLARKTQLTRAELYQHLDTAGIPIDAPPRGPMRGAHLAGSLGAGGTHLPGRAQRQAAHLCSAGRLDSLRARPFRRRCACRTGSDLLPRSRTGHRKGLLLVVGTSDG